MRHRRRVARFFSTDDDNDDDGDDDSRLVLPILSVRSELGGDRQYPLPRPSAYSSPIIRSFYRVNEEPRNTQAILPIRGSLCAGHERSRLRSIAVGQVELTCDKLAFLIRIFEQSINVTSIRRNLWRIRSHATRSIATYLAADIRKLDLIILSTSSASFPAIISHAAEMTIMQIETARIVQSIRV